MTRILIVDDHPMFREGLKYLLLDSSLTVSIDEAENAQETIDKLIKKEYDVVVLDVAMPGRNGLEIIPQLKDIQPLVHILVLSMYTENQYALRALKAGASGYITKNVASCDLIAAIRTVSNDKKFISQAMAVQLAEGWSSDFEKPLHETLSNREYQVMCMLAAGKQVSAIAKELSLSVSTVSTNRGRLLKKMNLRNNAEITYYAIKSKLIP